MSFKENMCVEWNSIRPELPVSYEFIIRGMIDHTDKLVNPSDKYPLIDKSWVNWGFQLCIFIIEPMVSIVWTPSKLSTAAHPVVIGKG